MNDRIRQFIEHNQSLKTPFLVIDVDQVETNYHAFKAAMPDAAIHYAVKANPDRAILQRLADLGSSFDCASVPEIQMVLNCGVLPERISYGNTIKKAADIARAYALGVRLFATDSRNDVKKLADNAPGSAVFCRILTDGEGADWPLSRKFGCDEATALDVLVAAHEAGLQARGISFHVGSQMSNTDAWRPALEACKTIFDQAANYGIKLDLVNLGGGFPTKYLKSVPDTLAYGNAINRALCDVFGEALPCVLIEPGRGMVGNAGAIKAEVVMVARKSHSDAYPWVFLDIGKFGGLAETIEEAIRYKIVTPRDAEPMVPCIIAGPTCDSADVLYEIKPYMLPETLTDGDQIIIESTGAYTTTYSAVAFNGFEPLRSYII